MAKATDSQSREKPAVCPLDCADTCSLSVRATDDRIERVRGSRVNPVTRGKICAKVARALPCQVHGKQRLLQPLLRSGPKGSGEFAPVSWDRALEIVYQRCSQISRDYGSEAIVPFSYGGPMGLLSSGSMDKRFFHRLGASRVDSSPLCAGTVDAAFHALFGGAGGIDYAELEHSRLIVVWGNNITTCNLHLVTLIRDAQRRGATLVVIDPRRTRIAENADLHIPLLPGTDVVLGYAIAALLERDGGLDHGFIARHVEGAARYLAAAREFTPGRAAGLCGIEQEQLHEFARCWRTLAPAAISMGVAPERNRNGGSGIRSALSLLALTGNIGAPGAGVCEVSRYFPVQREALTRPDLLPRSVRELNILDVPRLALSPDADPPLRALFIYNHNPVAVHPQQALMLQALESEHMFVVGSDVSMTDSMRCADVVFPAASHLEYGDLYTAYGHRYLQRSRAAIAPQGEAVRNTELFRRLAYRFGFTDACFRDSDEELVAQAFHLDQQGASELADGAALDMTPWAAPAMLRGAGFSTPSGRIELYSEFLEKECGRGLPQFRPLPDERAFILVTPASEQRINSTFGAIPGQATDIRCEMHPDDAREHGVQAGDRVRLYNLQGAVELPVTTTAAVRKGTLYVPKGAWIEDSATGLTVNALIPGHKSDIGDGACYYDCSVDLQLIR